MLALPFQDNPCRTQLAESILTTNPKYMGILVKVSHVAVKEVSAYSAALNHGSPFNVTRPLPEAAQESMKRLGVPPARPQLQSQTVAELKSMDILLVEDNHDAAQTMAMLLEFEGHRVVIAYNGQEALQRAEQRRFDAAILDIGLPDMDGYTLARRFRALPQQSETRLVAVTGYGAAQDVARAREAGFDKHIVKPIFDCQSLLVALQRSGPAA